MSIGRSGRHVAAGGPGGGLFPQTVGHPEASGLPIRYKGNVVIKYRFPGREAVAKKVNVGDRTTDIILTPDGK